MKDRMWRFHQAICVLPIPLRQPLMELTESEQEQVEEVRLRVGQPMTVLITQQEKPLPRTVREQDLERILELASQASMHQVLHKLRQGYLTIAGGHRLGVCGSVLMQDGKIHYIRPLSSVNLRIACEYRGVGKELISEICLEGRFTSTLILAPPGYGKTTLLRDLICSLSDGNGCFPHRIGLVDERGEIAAMYQGAAQLSVGRYTDILEGCPKREGLMMLLRGMNPQILAVDEITAPEDVEALQTAVGCGVSILASAHGRDMQDLLHRPIYRRMMERKIFDKVIYIDAVRGKRTYRVEELVCCESQVLD